MRQIAIAALLMIPTLSESWAEELPINCLYEKTAGQAIATCKIKNTSERAIAKIEYQIEVVSIGREVPWGSATGEIDIPGGIEPAEELTLGFPAPSLPQRAPAEGIKVSVTAARYVAVDGSTILAYPPEAAPVTLKASVGMSGEEEEAFAAALKACWNVGALSSEAMRTNVTVQVNMREDGRPVAASIKMVSYSGGSAEAARQAYEAARRAILRCGSTGLPLPTEKFASWQHLTITFSPSGLQIP